MLSGITLGCLLMLTTEGFSSSRICKIRCEDDSVTTSITYNSSCDTLRSKECQGRGGVNDITDLTQEENNEREQRERTRRNNEAGRAKQAAAAAAATADAAAIAAAAAAPTAPITNHACGSHSVACTIKGRQCIFMVDSDDQKIVTLPSKEIAESPKYRNGGVFYGCMKKDAYAKLPSPDTTDRGA